MITIEQLSKKIGDRGIVVDSNAILETIDILNSRQADLELSLKKVINSEMGIVPKDINLNSTRLMSEFIYGYLEAPVLKVTAAKREPSLDSETLEEISYYSPYIEMYSEYRSTGRQSSILSNIIKCLSHDGEVVHSEFNPNGTISGRFTSSNPNMQQIPHDFRKFFIARTGYKLYTIDMSQAEYQLAFTLAEAKPPEDIHSFVAQQLGIERSVAKVVNLGILYGMTPFGLAKKIKSSEEEAKVIIDNWLSNNFAVAALRDKVIRSASQVHAVKTITGRFVKDFFAPNDVRSFNILIQGSLSDIVKKAMLNIDKYLSVELPTAGIVLTEHDELVIEVPENVTKDQLLRIKDKFENVDINGKIYNFKVNAELGDCWLKV